MARSFAFGSLVAVALFAARVAAQPVSNATCVDQLWSTNSRQQSPCLVSAYLSAQCTNDNTWSVPEIGTEGPYSPPKGDYANLCRCNSVQWNLLSACSMCQGGPAGTWTEWISNCTQSVVNIGTYPLPVPAGVSIPHWAYYDFTTTGVFNAVTASQQSGPESVAVSSATSTATPIGTVTGTVTAPIIETPTGTSSNSTSKSGSNTGAIVGGVVGGILGIALIAVIGFVLMRKGKQNKPDNSANQYANQYAQGGYNPGGAQPPSAAPMMTQYQPGVQHPGMMSPAPGSEYKPYDPSDPSTFPGHNNPNAPSVYPESLAYTQNSQPRPGAYNYAPEV